MNIDEKCEYIDKYVNVEVATKWITVTLTVPLVTETSNGDPQVVVYLEDIVHYLEHKQIKFDHLTKSDSVVNTHPKGVSGTWVFRHSEVLPDHKRKRSGVGMKKRTTTKKSTKKTTKQEV